MADNRLTPVEALEIKLYRVIEQQAYLQNEFNKLEQAKGELAKQLGEARRAEQEAKEAAEEAPQQRAPQQPPVRPLDGKLTRKTILDRDE